MVTHIDITVCLKQHTFLAVMDLLTLKAHNYPILVGQMINYRRFISV